MNILIIGGNGYLGSKITRYFLREGHTLVCTRRRDSDLSRLSGESNKINWIPASADAVETAASYLKFDWIINTVCNYKSGTMLHENIIDANLAFPLKVLNIAAEDQIPNYLTIGTGLPDELNMYSFSKKIFSEFGRFYVAKHKINFFDLRLEMFYGSDEPEDRFLPFIIRNMLLGRNVDTTIGTQHRDIIAVQDILKAVDMVMKCGKMGYYEIPVGTGISPTISEIIDFIWKETGRRSDVHKGALPMRDHEPDCTADITFMRSIGIWEPVFWKNGIQKMIQDIYQILKKGEI